MNSFFVAERASIPFPTRLYARPVEWIEDEYLLFDAVDADQFDYFRKEFEGRISSSAWFEYVEHARIYAVEVDVLSKPVAPSKGWLQENPTVDLPEWAELRLEGARSGENEADLFDNINGPPVIVSLRVGTVTKQIASALRKATDLTPYVAPTIDIKNALPSSLIDQVFVLDVGQGAANALISGGDVVAYADLGAGVLKNSATWPTAFTGLCDKHKPTVILSHWHYDHFHGANKFMRGGARPAHGLTWIAPFQTLGPSVQSAMARNIVASGRLMVWNGKGTLSNGNVTLERCIGPPKGMNRDGIAVWVNGPKGQDPIPLPADAGYNDIPKLAGGAKLTAFTVSHHGGKTSGAPPSPPPTHPRAAFSFGHGNTHKHPNPTSISGLARLGWAVSSPPATVVDERRTEDRRASRGGAAIAGGAGLGHIKLDWASGLSPAHSCSCGCTLDPTQ